MNLQRYFYSSIQKLLEFVYKVDNNGSSVYMFHQVTDECYLWKDKHTSIKTVSFKEFIDRKLSEGIVFRPISDVTDFYTEKTAYITFDDVFSDAVENAIPYLVENAIPFCIFLTSEYIDTPGYITNEQILRLKKENLCTFGFHTSNHVIMRKTSHSIINQELTDKKLELLIGEKFRYFAFPYGSIYACSLYSRRRVKQEGYNLIFSTLSIKINKRVLKRFRHFIPRINVNDNNFRIK